MKCNLKSKILAFAASCAVALNLFISPVFAVKTYLHTLLEDTSKLVTVDDVRKILDEYPAWLDELDDKNQSPLYIAVHRKMDTVRDFLLSRGANISIAVKSAVYQSDSASVGYLAGYNTKWVDDSMFCIEYCNWLRKLSKFGINDRFVLRYLVGYGLPWKEKSDPEHSDLYLIIERKCTDCTVTDSAFCALNMLRNDAGLPELEYKEISTCVIA